MSDSIWVTLKQQCVERNEKLFNLLIIFKQLHGLKIYTYYIHISDIHIRN